MKWPIRFRRGGQMPAAAPPPDARKSLVLALPLGPGSAGSVSGSGRPTAGLVREGYLHNPIAHRAVRLIAEAAAAVPLLLYDGAREVTDHPLLALLARPNPQMAGPDFLEALYGHLLLSGNAYAEALMVTGRIGELHLLRPDRVTPVTGADGWPRAYDYRAGASLRRLPATSGEGRLALLHLKLFHPLDDQSGLPALAAAEAAIALHNAASRWNRALIDNSARPSGALVYQPKEGGNLSAQQYQRLKGELEEGYAGPARAGRPLLLEGGLDWKPMGLSPRDLDFAEARNGAARDIALAIGVPPMLLGIPGDNTYGNYQEANRALFRLTVAPLAARVAAALSAWFGDLYGPLRLEPDLDRVPGLASERTELWARIGAADFLTRDEKRQAVGY